MKYEVLIERSKEEGTWQKPAVLDEIEWKTFRKDTPSELSFTVLKDKVLGFNEGARVKFIVDKKLVFLGYVFEKSRDKDQQIKVVAYDQLRYFKYKNAYIFDNITLSSFLKRICDDFQLHTGTIEDTKYKISQILYENHTLFDMVQGCINDTLTGTNKLYMVYDEAGKICLKNIANMQLDIVINKNTAENFDYSSSINNDTYNRIKIQHSSSDKGIGQYTVVEDHKNIANWGVLQYFEAVSDWENEAKYKEKAKNLLKLYNIKKRSLTVKGCLGDVRCRAGTSPFFNLELGDLNLKNRMLIEEATHIFKDNQHTMDLRLSGKGEFYA